MKYEIVNLKEKIVAGLMVRASNQDPDMGIKIGGLWQAYYQEGVCQKIENKANGKCIGMYTDYDEKNWNEYNALVGCEVNEAADLLPEHVVTKTIPAGKYAKFVVYGDVVKDVQKFWTELWNMDLNRAFTCDFEEYQNADMENSEVHIYIAIR